MNGHQRFRRLSLAALALALGACGPTVGDPCSSDAACGPGVCLIKDYAPGGLCSRACVVGGAPCPLGSTCVEDAITRGEPGCLKTCARQSDCRDGYVCKDEKASATPVCIGPTGT
jgi:hypothetical protein